jgi:hypothetical protein
MNEAQKTEDNSLNVQLARLHNAIALTFNQAEQELNQLLTALNSVNEQEIIEQLYTVDVELTSHVRMNLKKFQVPEQYKELVETIKTVSGASMVNGKVYLKSAEIRLHLQDKFIRASYFLTALRDAILNNDAEEAMTQFANLHQFG